MTHNWKIAVALLVGAGVGALAVQGLHAQGKPSAYIITEVEIIDQAAFKEFSPKVAEAMRGAGAKYLARGENIVALDGTAPKRVTLQVYESMEKAKASRETAAWKELTALRQKATKTRAYIVEGMTN